MEDELGYFLTLKHLKNRYIFVPIALLKTLEDNLYALFVSIYTNCSQKVLKV